MNGNNENNNLLFCFSSCLSKQYECVLEAYLNNKSTNIMFINISI